MSKIPFSLGIVVDGNRRYGRQHHLTLPQSYLAGYDKVKEFCRWVFERKIPHLFIYAFSYENWQRPKREINILMRLFQRAIHENLSLVKRYHYRLKFIGRKDNFKPQLRELMSWAEKTTSHYEKGSLNICIGYGGRQEIVDAFKSILNNFKSTKISNIKQINEAYVAQYLYEPNLPELDLLIRPGGQVRLSNFMLWQSAYAELFFTPTLWPAFTESEFDKILDEFARRQRNFGV